MKKKILIDNKMYIIKLLPYKEYAEISNLPKVDFIAELLKRSVVSPKVTIEDFDNDYILGLELTKEIEKFIVENLKKSNIKAAGIFKKPR